MIDEEGTTSENDEQTDAVTLSKDTLEDLDVTTDDGADVRGGAPKDKEYEFGSDKPTNCQ